MADSSIRVGPSPRQDRGTIDDQVARPDQPTTDGGQHREAEERLRDRRSGAGPAFPLVRGAGNARRAILTQR